MNLQSSKPKITTGRTTSLHIIGYLAIIILMINLNAMVDVVLHPEIPYFDKEHLIVGGVTGFVSMVLFGLLALYVGYLDNALRRIQTLEAILPICSNCKKIRKSDSDSKKNESWQPIEAYITEKTSAEFSHSVCPKCASKLYPQFYDRILSKEKEGI